MTARAGPDDSFLTWLKKDLDAAVQADGGDPWVAAETAVKEFPSPSNPHLATREHRRAVALVVKTIGDLASERHRARGKIVRTMAAAHAAYDRSKGRHGRSFEVFIARLRELRALYAVHDRGTEFALRLATALRTPLLASEDAEAWGEKLRTRWAGARIPDDQLLWIAFLEGGPKPDLAALVASVDDAGLAPPARAAALEALARHAPDKGLSKARALLTPPQEAWQLSSAALRILRGHATANDASLLSLLASTGTGWLGLDARALRAKLSGGEPPTEAEAFGIPIGSGCVLFLVDGSADMGADFSVTAGEIAKAVDALPSSTRVAVWIASNPIRRLLASDPVLLMPSRARSLVSALQAYTPHGDGLPPFFEPLEKLVFEQRESPDASRIDTVVVVTRSVLYQDDRLVQRCARWASQAGVRIHCVCFVQGRHSERFVKPYRRLAESTGGTVVVRPDAKED